METLWSTFSKFWSYGTGTKDADSDAADLCDDDAVSKHSKLTERTRTDEMEYRSDSDPPSDDSKTEESERVTLSDHELMDWIRTQWAVGSKCEVYSASAREWVEGDVARIGCDAEGEWMEMQYVTESNERRTKKVQRGDRRRIRPSPLSGGLALYEQQFGNNTKKRPFGLSQSPINLMMAAVNEDGVDGHSASSTLNSVRIEYPETVTAASIINNGFTVQINIGDDAGCRLMIGETAYFLKQFHFHTPSEHRIDSHQLAMEMHLVHIAADGRIAVMGFLFTVNDDENEDGHSFLKQFWSQLPAEKTTADIPLETALRFKELFGATGLTVDGQKQKGDGMEWFQYDGSLTTPPYTEGLQWFVNRSLHSMTKEELRRLSGCWGNVNNARSTQDYFGRKVTMKGDVCCSFHE